MLGKSRRLFNKKPLHENNVYRLDCNSLEKISACLMQNVRESCPLEMSLIRLYGRATFVLSKQDSLHNYVWSYSSSETRKGECNYWF